MPGPVYTDTAGPPLLITDAVLTAIREHAAAAYPDECCGALLGYDGADSASETAEGRVLRRAIPLVNHWSDGPGSHFLIPAATVRRIDAYARRQALELVGFYHSHPAGAPVPSAFDLEAAWPWYSYLIVAVGGTNTGTVRGWILTDDRTTFVEHPLQILQEGREEPCRSR